jgi:uncharacterized protein YjiK
MRFSHSFIPVLIVALAAARMAACSVQHSTGTPSPQQNAVGAGETNATTSHAWYFSQGFTSTTNDASDSAALPNGAQGYELDHPDRTWLLPKALNEISDISVLSDSELACVEDEHGVIYVYDLNAGRVTDAVHFGSKGDYEGLAVVGTAVFVLRSDGRLYELSSLKRHASVQSYDLHLPIAESEGLCWDAKHGRLLIAPKSRHSDQFDKDVRPVFAYDLEQHAVATAPAFQVNVHDVRRFAKHHDLPLPRHFSKEKQRLRSSLHFMPSAIAVHPRTGSIFLLSSVDHLLVSCDEAGNITGYALLDANLFRRPEGLAFMSNGDLLISNEAAGGQASVLLFRCKGLGC